MRLVIEEEYFYLSFQGGPADDVVYKTKAEAKVALHSLSPMLRRGTHIMSRVERRIFEETKI